MRVLVVEDDEVLMNGLQVGLAMNGYTVDAVGTCAEAEAALLANAFDAVVLDLMLPDGSGLDLLTRMRKRDMTHPVLLLTARDTVSDRIAGLDAGADDYLGKPFDLDEAAARLRALTRRAVGRAAPALIWGDVVMDLSRLEITKAGEPVRLSRREFTVLRALLHRPGSILSKSQIEEKLYGWQEEIESNAVEVHIHHIRNKLGGDFIETVRGIGYRVADKR